MKKLLVTVNVLLLMIMVSALFGAGKTSTVQFIFATTASKSVSNPVADPTVGINMHLSSGKIVPFGIKNEESISWIPVGKTWFSAHISKSAPADQQYELKFYLVNDSGENTLITSTSPSNLTAGATNKVKVVFQYPQVEFNLINAPTSHAGGIGITLHHASWSQSLGSKNDTYIDWIPVADYWFTADETIQKEGIKLKFSYNGTEITQNNPITFKSAQQYTVNIEFDKQIPKFRKIIVNITGLPSTFSYETLLLTFADSKDVIISQKKVNRGQNSVLMPSNTYIVSLQPESTTIYANANNYSCQNIYYLNDSKQTEFGFNYIEIPGGSSSQTSAFKNYEVLLSGMHGAQFGEIENPVVAVFIFIDFNCLDSRFLFLETITEGTYYKNDLTLEQNFNNFNNAAFITMLKKNKAVLNIVNSNYLYYTNGSLHGAQVGIQVYKKSPALYYKYLGDMFTPPGGPGEHVLTAQMVDNWAKKNNIDVSNIPIWPLYTKNKSYQYINEETSHNRKQCPIINLRYSINYDVFGAGGPLSFVTPISLDKVNESSFTYLNEGYGTTISIFEAAILKATNNGKK